MSTTAAAAVEGLVSGAVVEVSVPATSANLGPGFDSLGLALDLCDDLVLETGIGSGRLEIEVTGQGEGAVPLDASHLVVRSMRTLLVAAGITGEVAQVTGGMRLRCTNRIPHGRGLGSSAAAIGAGLLLARGLLTDQTRFSDDDILDLATAAEGHPDNAAAVFMGGFTIAWMNGGAPADSRLSGAVQGSIDPSIRAVVAVPAGELATERARAILPESVPHADAAFNASRAALLVQAMAGRPDLLMEATADRLHQRQRESAMPISLALMDAVRAAGVAATISGAGPCVLALGAGPAVAAAVHAAVAASRGQWQVLEPQISTQGAQVKALGSRAL